MSGILAPNEDERRDVEGLRQGNVAAFDRVHAAYGKRIYSFLLRLSGRRTTAEDLAQETWIKLAKAAPGLREDTRLGPLLYTIARNAFVSHRRWAMLDLSRIVMVGYEAMTAFAAETTPEIEHERVQAIAILERALQTLPLVSREVLLLVAVEGLEQDEVATILGVSYDALRQRLSRARAQLADAMDRLERAPGSVVRGSSPVELEGRTFSNEKASSTGSTRTPRTSHNHGDGT